ncbi:hypothetical protein XELAEV_18011374mg [Xenopus laevis]|uniref:Uncharacterized protein n=1 Tax=Xenopus laevis TaxID=8355 RepID=A0A974DKP1_XENLA|nr:hypothetical protein XELAEV_18011374mg [Xenopus laevis]
MRLFKWDGNILDFILSVSWDRHDVQQVLLQPVSTGDFGSSPRTISRLYMPFKQTRTSHVTQEAGEITAEKKMILLAS